MAELIQVRCLKKHLLNGYKYPGVIPEPTGVQPSDILGGYLFIEVLILDMGIDEK